VGVLLLAALWGYFAMQGVGRLGERVSQMGLVRCLLEFWLGNVLRLLWGRWCGVAGAATAAWLAAVAALLGGLALGWHETSFIPACFAALILALALDKGLPARAGRPVARLYGRDQLFHLSGALSAVRAVQAGLCGGVPQIGWGQLAAYLLLVLAASVVMYHGVEKPAQRWLNGLWNHKAPPLAAAE
jgi:peptidoglycan/LPS O-acetylase OafA/YrhL